MNQKKLFGILGIAGAGVLLITTVIAIITFENGVFSPLNCFFNELGLYPGGYLTVSSALIFNIGMAVFGFAFCAFMVFWGICQNNWADGLVAFLGILTGVLAIAQAVFTLDFASYHYIVTAAFSVAVFALGAAFIIVSLTTGKNRSIATMLVAFFAAASGAVFAVYMFTGGMMQVFIEDASMVGRLNVMPLAIVGWFMLLLTMALLVLFSVDILLGRQPVSMAPAGNFHRNTRDIDYL